MSENKAPAIQWYPDKWQFDTRRLSWKAKGIYHELLMVMWMQFQDMCSIPDDDQFIAAEVGCSLEDWRESRTEIMNPHRPLLTLKEGRLFNNGLWKEKVKQAAFRQKQQDNGSKGGRPKGSKNKDKKPMGFSEETQIKTKKSLPSPSLSPTPSPNKKNKNTLSVEYLVSEGVDREHAEDWLQVRNAKHKPLTKTAWKAIKREAAKAKILPAQAVEIAAEKGWVGFNSQWFHAENLKPKDPNRKNCEIENCRYTAIELVKGQWLCIDHGRAETTGPPGPEQFLPPGQQKQKILELTSKIKTL